MTSSSCTSSSTSSSELIQLRATIDSLSSFQHHSDFSSPLLFPTASHLHRYISARETYIKRHTLQSFLQFINENSLELPVVTTDDWNELKEREEEVEKLAQCTFERAVELMDKKEKGMEECKTKWMELDGMAAKLERAEADRTDDDWNDNQDDNDDDTMDITDEAAAHQENLLQSLRQKRHELEHKLRMVRAQIQTTEENVHNMTLEVNEVRVRTGRKVLSLEVEGDYNNNNNNISAQESVQAEIAEMQEKTSELLQSSEFYQGMRELMDELGGVRILSTKLITEEDNERISMSNVPEGKTQHSNSRDGFFLLTLQLLGNHILEVIVNNTSIQSAKLLTSTSFPVPPANPDPTTETTLHSLSLTNTSLSKLLSQPPSSSLHIPPLDDLLFHSHSLTSTPSAIRFLLLETMARIRTVESRMMELIALRSTHAAQVYHVDGEEEVVCTLREGISVALRLGYDCPLMPGSVRITEMFGVGGWDEERLEELRGVVEGERCRGPVEVMDVLVREIGRMVEEGWVLPRTPCALRKRGTDMEMLEG